MRRIELAGFLASVGGKVADEVLVDKAQDVVILTSVHGDVLDEVDEVTRRFGLAARVCSQLGKTGLQRVEDALEHPLASWVDVAVEGTERVMNV